MAFLQIFCIVVLVIGTSSLVPFAVASHVKVSSARSGMAPYGRSFEVKLTTTEDEGFGQKDKNGVLVVYGKVGS